METLANHPANTGRHSGVLLPLFSMRSKNDWGIGDFKSLQLWIRWSGRNKTKILQILPIHEMPPGQDCPYTALSAFALDPVYICIEDIEDFRSSPQAAALAKTKEFRAAVKELRLSKTVLYSKIKDLKFKVLWLAFRHFYETDWQNQAGRAAEFGQYCKANAGWLEDYAVFRALKDVTGWKSWLEWDEPLRRHEKQALAEFRRSHEQQVMFFEYLQWVADIQWRKARAEAASAGVWLFGDLPFMVNQESADVWGHQDVFNVGIEIGAPPDQFSAEGQRWGLPAYNWHNLESSNFGWWRARVRRAREMYDLFRLDHLVGFFRTWNVPKDKTRPASFDEPDERRQEARGDKFLRAVIEESAGALPVAEDLGVIPDFVRATLSRLHIPGYKVMRWEKDGPTFRDPAKYPRVSLATTSTHDTDTVKQWWHEMPEDERAKAWEMLSGEKAHHPAYSDKVHSAVLNRILGAASGIVLLPLQDILGLADRINVPGTVGGHNWTYRFPLSAEKLTGQTKFSGKIQEYVQSLEANSRAN